MVVMEMAWNCLRDIEEFFGREIFQRKYVIHG